MKKLTLIPLLLLTFIFVTTKDTGVNAAAANSSGKRAIVKFSIFTPGFARQSIIKGQGASIAESARAPNTIVINVPVDKSEKILRALNRNIFVDYAEEDFIADALDTPNDPLFSSQWGLTNIDAEDGWYVSHGASNVHIAILDTGVNSTHPDLTGKIDLSVNCIYSSCPNYTTNDPQGHGTHVAGIAAAATNNSVGVAGVDWESRIMSVKVLNDRGSGYYSWIANGIYWATDNGADVINMSFGGGSSSLTLENAVNYAWDKGVVVVSAAGNDGRNGASYPAYYDSVIAVTAVDANDRKAGFSNYGSWVDVAAPGVDILSTYHDSYDYLSGTSMSTPMVSGLAGLIKSNYPTYNNSQIRSKIDASSDKINGTGSYWRYGRINVCSALDCDQISVSPTFTPTPTSKPTFTPSPTQTPTVTPTDTPTPSPTLTTIVSSTPTPTLVVSPSITPTPSPNPTPTSSDLPWWCKYIPWHYTCQ